MVGCLGNGGVASHPGSVAVVDVYNVIHFAPYNSRVADTDPYDTYGIAATYIDILGDNGGSRGGAVYVGNHIVVRPYLDVIVENPACAAGIVETDADGAGFEHVAYGNGVAGDDGGWCTVAVVSNADGITGVLGKSGEGVAIGCENAVDHHVVKIDIEDGVGRVGRSPADGHEVGGYAVDIDAFYGRTSGARMVEHEEGGAVGEYGGVVVVYSAVGQGYIDSHLEHPSAESAILTCVDMEIYRCHFGADPEGFVVAAGLVLSIPDFAKEYRVMVVGIDSTSHHNCYRHGHVGVGFVELDVEGAWICAAGGGERGSGSPFALIVDGTADGAHPCVVGGERLQRVDSECQGAYNHRVGRIDVVVGGVAHLVYRCRVAVDGESGEVVAYGISRHLIGADAGGNFVHKDSVDTGSTYFVVAESYVYGVHGVGHRGGVDVEIANFLGVD